MTRQARRKQQPRKVSNDLTHSSVANSPEQKNLKHGMREIILILFCFMGIYLFVSLITYYPPDPGWSHVGNVDEVKNQGGIAGAWLADTFFYIFGYLAYLVPIIVTHLGFVIYQGRHHSLLEQPKTLIIPSIGFFLTIIAGCGLAIVHFASESVLLPSHAGGILGMMVGKSLQNIFSNLGATLLLMALFFMGITLLTGLSWLKLMDALGYQTLRILPILEDILLNHVIPFFLHYINSLFSWIGHFIQTIYFSIRNMIRMRWDDWHYNQQAKNQHLAILEEEPEKDDFFAKNLKNNHKIEEVTTEKPELAIHPSITHASPLPVSTTIPPIKSEKTSVLFPLTATLDELPELDAVTPLLPPLPLLNPAPPFRTPNTEAAVKAFLAACHTQELTAHITAIQTGAVFITLNIEFSQPIDNKEEIIQDLRKQLTDFTQVNIYLQDKSKGYIEITHAERQLIPIRTLLENPHYQDSPAHLPVMLGQDTCKQPVIMDLSRLPAALIVATENTEKITAIHNLLLNLLYRAVPENLRLILIDGQAQELAIYHDLPHLIAPVLTQEADVQQVLQWCVREMERRYRCMAERQVRNLESYNAALHEYWQENLNVGTEDEPLYHIVVVISEAAEWITPPEKQAIETLLLRLAQKARAAGIHIVLATQYPANNVLKDSVRAVFSTRWVFKVNNKTESRLALGALGAENLLNQGDMWYMTTTLPAPLRVHTAQVTLEEVQQVVENLADRAEPDYVAWVE